jgi:hypothetical protein
MKLSNEPESILKRFEMVFLNESRECVFLKPVGKLTVGDKTVGPFKKGDRTFLQNWVIEKLLNGGLVEIIPAHFHESLRRLQNLYREEEKQRQLQDFNPSLYAAIGRRLLSLQSDKTSMDPRRFDEIEKLQRMVPLLVETRLSKILRIAKANAFRDKKSQMSHEEQWLCEQLAHLLAGWRQYIIG